jgi:hypothetical protein
MAESSLVTPDPATPYSWMPPERLAAEIRSLKERVAALEALIVPILTTPLGKGA